MPACVPNHGTSQQWYYKIPQKVFCNHPILCVYHKSSIYSSHIDSPPFPVLDTVQLMKRVRGFWPHDHPATCKGVTPSALQGANPAAQPLCGNMGLACGVGLLSDGRLFLLSARPTVARTVTVQVGGFQAIARPPLKQKLLTGWRNNAPADLGPAAPVRFVEDHERGKK